MKRKRFTEEQIINILAQYATGVAAAEIARQHGIAESTLYAWKAKYGNMKLSDVKRLKELEAENKKLKKLVANAIHEKDILKRILSRKL